MSELSSCFSLVHDLPFERAVDPYLHDLTAYTGSWAKRSGMPDLVGSASWATSRYVRLVGRMRPAADATRPRLISDATADQQ
jgi:hypothetical protein